MPLNFKFNVGKIPDLIECLDRLNCQTPCQPLSMLTGYTKLNSWVVLVNFVCGCRLLELCVGLLVLVLL